MHEYRLYQTGRGALRQPDAGFDGKVAAFQEALQIGQRVEFDGIEYDVVSIVRQLNSVMLEEELPIVNLQ